MTKNAAEEGHIYIIYNEMYQYNGSNLFKIGKSKDVINRIVVEINKEDNKMKWEKEIINPILLMFSNKIYPYVSLLFIMYSINLLLIIIVLVLTIMYNKK